MVPEDPVGSTIPDDGLYETTSILTLDKLKLSPKPVTFTRAVSIEVIFNPEKLLNMCRILPVMGSFSTTSISNQNVSPTVTFQPQALSGWGSGTGMFAFTVALNVPNSINVGKTTRRVNNIAFLFLLFFNFIQPFLDFCVLLCKLKIVT